MKGNTGKVHIGPEGELYKYINHHTGTPTKARSENKKQYESRDLQFIWTESSWRRIKVREFSNLSVNIILV